MGNAHTSGKGPLEYTPSMMKGYPMLFHDSHSQNIQLSPDKRRAKRVESFCKGICFGNRPVAINERVYIKFSEISTSWSGVLRFGFTAHEPGTLNPAELPRYACPDLTNKPGFWAKALPERVAVQGNILFFYVTRAGDCKFGVNNEDKGVFFSGIDINNFLYPLVDIYGNTTSMEFVDGRQISTQEVLHHSLSASQSSLPTQVGMIPATPPQHHTHAGLPHARSMPTTPVVNTGMPGQIVAPSMSVAGASPGQPPILHHAANTFNPLPFHQIIGRSVCLSADKTIAVRLVEEYCNGYVFSSRPLQCGEKLVIQIMSVDRTFCGGIAFGMTACDPSSIIAETLPDDSDLLLDRPEYWIVNKDVCTNPDIGDELSFCLTHEGQVIYGRNGHNIATLMHIDKTLPMWPFFDIYGNTQKIKCLGVTSVNQQGDRGILQVSLPPSRNESSSSLASMSNSATSPPRPPPPRTSPGSMKNSPRSSPVGSRSTAVHSHDSSPPPPTLPPKQNRSLGASPQLGHGLPPAATSAAAAPDLHLPPPLIPMPSDQHTQSQNDLPPKNAASNTSASTTSPKKVAPAIPPRTIDQWHRKTVPKSEVAIAPPPGNQSQESVDNASNECCVCLENPPNSVLYTCGHMCMCYECAVDIQKNQGGLCPMCRKEIKDIIKIFRS